MYNDILGDNKQMEHSGNPLKAKVQDVVNEIKVDPNNKNFYMSLLSKEDEKDAEKLLKEQAPRLSEGNYKKKPIEGQVRK